MYKRQYYQGEGFAGSLIDAMAAGLPIIASDWKYNREIVKNGTNGLLFPASDADALSKRLVWLYKHQNEWNDFRKNCLDEAHNYLPEIAMREFISDIKGLECK